MPTLTLTPSWTRWIHELKCARGHHGEDLKGVHPIKSVKLGSNRALVGLLDSHCN
jgi:hypothetical protein